MQPIIPKTQSRPFCQGGFTLIELLISIAIFSIGIMAVGMMQIHSTASTSRASKMTDNIVNTTDRIEKLIALNYYHTDLDETDDYDPNDPDKPESSYTTPPHAPAQDEDRIDNDGDGAIDEAGESGPISIRWWVTVSTPKPGSDTYNYKTVTVRIEREGPGGSFLVLQRYIPRTTGV